MREYRMTDRPEYTFLVREDEEPPAGSEPVEAKQAPQPANKARKAPNKSKG